MKYDPYSLTELIRNDDFISWVRYPNKENEARWQQFLADYPEKRGVVEDARGYVNLLAEDTGKHKPTTEQSKKMWSVVQSHLAEEEKQEDDTVVEQTNSGWQWIRIAAFIALSIGFAFTLYRYLHKTPNMVAAGSTEKKAKVSGIVEKVNSSDKPMTILLEDGSSVVLQPSGRLTFAAVSQPSKREVSLKGRAFFEIVKDPQRPFLVYTDGLATKVLGTSFSIDAPENGSEIKVEVKTGKVSVFPLRIDASDSEKEALSKSELKGTILVHDEKIAFSRLNGKTLKLDEPVVAAVNNTSDIANQLFIFDETPVSEVFRTLENAYNMKILYKESLMSTCPLNATLVGQSFTEKLNVICAALDAQFEIKDNQVTITGNGCK